MCLNGGGFRSARSNLQQDLTSQHSYGQKMMCGHIPSRNLSYLEYSLLKCILLKPGYCAVKSPTQGTNVKKHNFGLVIKILRMVTGDFQSSVIRITSWLKFYSKDKRQAHKLEVQEVLLLNSLFLIPQNEEFQFEHPETEIGR